MRLLSAAALVAAMLIAVALIAHGEELQLKPGLYATLKTSMGDITILLYEKETPKTVANFVGLANGEKEWRDPKTGEVKKSRFYDGLIFHRVIPDFMIQTGCPMGTGRGGPGYRFNDEIVPELKFDRPGIVGMANSGPNSNGSQFFITEVPTPWLNGKHTVFGEVVEGMDVVKKIARADTAAMDKPVKDVVIKQVIIKRVE